MRYPITTDRPWEPLTLPGDVDTYWNGKDFRFSHELGNHSEGWLALDISVEITGTGPQTPGGLISFRATGRLRPVKFHPNEARADFRPRLFSLEGSGMSWFQEGTPPRPGPNGPIGGYYYVQRPFASTIQAQINPVPMLNIVPVPGLNARYFFDQGWRRQNGSELQISGGGGVVYSARIEGIPVKHY